MESKIHRRYPVGSAKRRTLRSTLRCVQVLLRCTVPPARELILEGKAEPGDTVQLLWREKLGDPFTQHIVLHEGKATSGPCTATRIEGGWRCVDSGDGDGKGADEWVAMDNDDQECMANTFAVQQTMWYTPNDAGGAPATPAGAAAARPKKKQRTGAASLGGAYR